MKIYLVLESHLYGYRFGTEDLASSSFEIIITHDSEIKAVEETQERNTRDDETRPRNCSKTKHQ